MGSKVKLFMDKLNNVSDIEYFDKYMLFLLAPVVSGFKPSSTVTLKKKSKEYLVWINYKKAFMKKIGLDYIVLREDENAIILLVYSKQSLEKIINSKKVKKFLVKLGYTINLNFNISDILDVLVYRYEKIHCPHELGIFLGIPLDDVIDFMECKEKKCLICGYWKVFNDFDNAIEIFNNYNKSKEVVLDCGILEIQSNKIIDMLKNNIEIAI